MPHSRAHPTAQEPVSAVADPARWPKLANGRPARLAVFGLTIAGVLPPLAFTAQPGELGLIGPVPLGIVLLGLLILAPALVGLVIALLGLEAVHESFRRRGDQEHEQAVLRVFVCAAMLAYGFALAVLAPADAGACRIVAALGLVGAWVLLLLAMLDPTASAVRRTLGALVDAAVISAFLALGGEAAAPWFPLYLVASFYAGFRFGTAALATTAGLGLVGFAVTIAAAPFWRHQPLLAGGVIAALIALPVYVGGMVRLLARSRAEAAAAQAARTRFLMVISQALRGPLDAIIGGMTGAGHGEREVEAATMVPSARALLSQVGNILDFSAIEAGALVPETEAFDLHAVINGALSDRRAQAAGKGLQLRLHVDPTVPYRLLGWPRQLRQIVDYLVARAIDVSDSGMVRVVVDAAGRDERRLHLRLTVGDEGAAVGDDGAAALTVDASFESLIGAAAEPRRRAPNASGQGALGLAVVKRLVQLMGGEVAVATGRGKGGRLTVTVPLAVDTPEVDSALDLAGCPVLIATEDSQFAGDLAEPLNAWHGDPQWIDGFEGVPAITERGAASPAVLIVDGRTRLLAALSFAHRVATGPAAPDFILFVAEDAQIDGLIDLADGELDALLPAPLGDQLLANALHALPLSPRPTVTSAPPAAVEDPAPVAAAAASQVTPIAAHPRFAADTATVDARAIAALRGLGGDDFLDEVIDTFRLDSQAIMQRLGAAAATADAPGFVRALNALRNCAGHLGGARLGELLLSLREVTGEELRTQGGALMHRLGDELARFDAALAGIPPERVEARR